WHLPSTSSFLEPREIGVTAMFPFGVFWTFEDLEVKRVDDFQKEEPVEIRIPCADLPDSVLTHENGRVSLVQEIASKVWGLRDDLPGYLGVALRRNEDVEPGRGDERCDKQPGFRKAPRPPHHPRVSRHAQELVKDRPGGIPGIRAPALAIKPSAAGGMK